MKILLRITICILWTLVISSCQNIDEKVEKKVVKIIEKDFGLHETENDQMSVELQLDQFKDYDELINRAEMIACHDSIPKVTLQGENELRRVYLRIPCSENTGCILIKQKNVIEIHNDTINKLNEHFYPLDSLANVLRRDLENNGKIPYLCHSPEKLLIFISYDSDGLKKFPNTLKRLVNAYESVTDRNDLKIWIRERILIPTPPQPLPPPQPPIRLEEIELVEEGE
ncbi:hypothetical protein [uncultured Kordia sp.]|uniref:hypothetical protein n=1 Tax=uncultured Kordia sp. TaxID=507699 RepID=UPI00261816C5|nr:hypothetical protein [uncultured Kordia sp.]